MGLTFQAYAQQRTDRQMLQIARQHINQHTATADGTPELRKLLTRDQLNVYGTEGGGFVVVARDANYQGVIGYSDSRLDPERMPDGLAWWLDQVDAGMAERRNNPAIRKVETNVSPVSPMLTTRWAQDTPYNKLCPLTSSFWSQTASQTGCVATAMAQILNYHKYPANSVGKSYYLLAGSNTPHNVTLSTTFDWANMRNSYGYGYSEAESKAVAELMRDCGYCSHMSYSAQGSGATVYDAGSGLAHNMQVDSLSLRVCNRFFHTDDDWMELIYKELQAGRPILYNATDPDQLGHAFVFDGLDAQGRVHVNWGWAGDADGYFDVRNLRGLAPSYPNPYGGTISYRFSDAQMMITGIKPQSQPDADEEYHTNFVISERDSMWIDKDSLKLKSVPVFNFSHLTFNGLLGLVIEGEDGHAVVQPFYYTPWNGGQEIPPVNGVYCTDAYYPNATLLDSDGRTPRPDGQYWFYLVAWSKQQMSGGINPDYIRMPVASAPDPVHNYGVWTANKVGGHWDATSMRRVNLSDEEGDQSGVTATGAATSVARVYNTQGHLLYTGTNPAGANFRTNGPVIIRQGNSVRKVVR